MIIRTLLAVALISAAALGVSQDPELFPGTDLPITMKPSDIGPDYKPLKLKEQSSGALGDYYSTYYIQASTLGLGGPAAFDDKRLTELFEMLPVAWTREKTVTLYAQQYVVTYILEPSIEELRAFGKGQALVNPMLKLKLMKADQIGSIEPHPGLTKEKYLQTLDRLSTNGKGVASPASRAEALSNIKQAALGIHMYLADHDDIAPYVNSRKTLQRVVMPYVKNSSIWSTTNPASVGDLFWNMSLSGVSLTDVENPAETPMLYDPTPWPDGKMLVAFADGHAAFVEPDRWEELQKYMRLKLKRHGKPIKD